MNENNQTEVKTYWRSSPKQAKLFLTVITVPLIHYWPVLWYSSCFMSACGFSSAVLVRPPPALTNIQRSPQTFLLFLFRLSYPPVFQSFASSVFVAMMPSSGFLLHLWSPLHRSPSFPPFPVCVSLPSLVFQNHPSFSPSISSICSDAFFSSHFSPVLLFFSSLSSFICLLVHLFTGKDFWSLEVIMKLLQLFVSFLPSFLLPFFLLHSAFFLSSSLSLSVEFIVFPPSWAFNSYFGLFLYLNFVWLVSVFSTICSLFLRAVGASLTVQCNLRVSQCFCCCLCLL